MDPFGEAPIAADELFEDETDVAEGTAGRDFWVAFWTIFGVLALPAVVRVAYPLLARRVGAIPATTLALLAVAGAGSYCLHRLASCARVVQIVCGGMLVVVATALLAPGTPFTVLTPSQNRDSTPPDQSVPRSMELSADYLTLRTLSVQHTALRRRLSVLDLDGEAQVGPIDGQTRDLDRQLARHEPGDGGARVRAAAREWASQLRACRLAGPSTVRFEGGSLTCR